MLDVGCGERPYEAWLPLAERYVGLDVVPGPGVDVLVEAGERWPLEDGEFDTVLCLQVVEHVRDLDLLLSEIERVLKPGGRLVVAMPFIYSEHDDPHDYRRLSRHGMALELSERFEVLDVQARGGVGSSAGSLLLNSIEVTMTRNPVTVVAMLALLPLWLLFTIMVNLCGRFVDRLDRSRAAYAQVIALAAKPERS